MFCCKNKQCVKFLHFDVFYLHRNFNDFPNDLKLCSNTISFPVLTLKFVYNIFSSTVYSSNCSSFMNRFRHGLHHVSSNRCRFFSNWTVRNGSFATQLEASAKDAAVPTDGRKNQFNRKR